MSLQYGRNPLPTEVTHENLTVVSLNMAKESRVDRILADIRHAVFFETADVWLLQEARPSVSEMAEALGMHYIYASANYFDDATVSRLAIHSLYNFERSDRTALASYNQR